jgi:hypothetical protein
MPFSNYGPLIDPNAPPTVQALYQGTNPDFVFEAPSPYNKVNRIRAMMRLGGDVFSIGLVVYLLNTNPTLQSLSWNDIWTGILTDLKPTGDEENIYYIFAAIAIFIALSVLVGIFHNIKKAFFTNEKLWYIGTTNNLIIFDKKKSDSINWADLKTNTEYQSTPTGDILSIKFKNNSIPLLKILEKKSGMLKSLNAIDIINPPNSMEVKRLVENRIKEHSNEPTNEDKELQELQELEKLTKKWDSWK